ncbi:MAG TPA: hypothetical protein VEI73_08735 [Candidatus Acidoferrum sp.]|nr:hypothetical protein [Candidatus Acidoferrum sp.]
MASTPLNHDQMKGLWKRFVKALRTVLYAQPQDPLRFQFQKVRDEALLLAEGEPMADEIANRYIAAVDAASPTREAAALVGEELNAFEAATNAQASGLTGQKGIRKRLIAAAKTILGSVKELFELSPYGKAILGTLKEILEVTSEELD